MTTWNKETNTCTVCGNPHNGVPHFACEAIAFSKRQPLQYLDKHIRNALEKEAQAIESTRPEDAAFFRSHKVEIAEIRLKLQVSIEGAYLNYVDALEALKRDTE